MSILTPLPPSQPDPASPFGIEQNINIRTIDDYLGRNDAVYRDVRMMFDTADFTAMGGSSDIMKTIEGFKIASYPLIGTLPPIPIRGAYRGESLFEVSWGAGMGITEVIPRYQRSMQFLEEVFPRDKAIFLMCNAGGYASFAKALLVFLGWDPSRLYNIGGIGGYTGAKSVDLITTDEDGNRVYHLWRAERIIIDFEKM